MITFFSKTFFSFTNSLYTILSFLVGAVFALAIKVLFFIDHSIFSDEFIQEFIAWMILSGTLFMVLGLYFKKLRDFIFDTCLEAFHE